MIQPIVDRFIENKPAITARYAELIPNGITYKDMLTEALKIMFTDDDYNLPCHNRVHEIDDGDYQGTKLFVIADWSYQPDTYYLTHNYYGSCSGCDSLRQATELSYIEDDDCDRNGLNQAAEDCYTLALHMFQRMTVYDASA